MGSHNILNKLYAAPFVIPDPGDGGTIKAHKWGVVCNLKSAGAETRILAAPLKAGDRCKIVHKTYVGAITLTVTGGYNQNGDTTIIMGTAGDWIEFEAVDVTGTLRWGVIKQEGTNLTDTDVVTASLTATAAALTAALITTLKLTATNVAATGSVIANAAALSHGINFVASADNTTGVQLPAGTSGEVLIVKSTVASKTLPVYPPLAGTINGGSANAAATLDSVAAGAAAVFVAHNASAWFTICGDLS